MGGAAQTVSHAFENVPQSPRICKHNEHVPAALATGESIPTKETNDLFHHWTMEQSRMRNDDSTVMFT